METKSHMTRTPALYSQFANKKTTAGGKDLNPSTVEVEAGRLWVGGQLGV